LPHDAVAFGHGQFHISEQDGDHCYRKGKISQK
jgi:hypothetical protein